MHSLSLDDDAKYPITSLVFVSNATFSLTCPSGKRNKIETEGSLVVVAAANLNHDKAHVTLSWVEVAGSNTKLAQPADVV